MAHRKIRDIREDFFFIGPGFAVFLIIVFLSFLMGVYYSFTEWNGINREAIWIGIENYRTIFRGGDPEAMTAALFTIRFTLLSVMISNLLAFALALALTMALKTANALRTIIFLPNVIGGIILGFVWRFVFSNSFGSIGELTGITFFELPWLGTPGTGFWGSVIVFVWQRTGYLMVIYIAAIVTINEDLLEAARIDGASNLTMLWKIIVPLTVPAITVSVFLALSWTTKMFDIIFALTGGGPFGSTQTFAMNIYFEAFRYNNYGIGSAKAILFFLAVGIISTTQVLVTKRWEVES